LDGGVKEEKIFGERAVAYLHGDRLDQKWLRVFVCRLPLVSFLYGLWQKMPWTKKKISPFVREFGVDPSEFVTHHFSSFNDFFIRTLKAEARPICPEANAACLPADARYRFFENVASDEGFYVKGEKFCLATLLGDPTLAKKYERGSMAIARLCPSDYHRFHFPCDGVPEPSKRINGHWFSVNPISLKKNIHVLTQNKRIVTRLLSSTFGEVLLVAIGATNVGSIVETFPPGQKIKKGDEMGYFSFGGSALVLLFEPGKIQFDADLIAGTKKGLEIRALMGSRMGLGSL
jgi:phosphatidylserine decarboxylase